MVVSDALQRVIIFVFILLIFITISFCQKYEKTRELAQKVMNQIDACADLDVECMIDFAELTDFDWDKMLVMDAIDAYTEKQIEEDLGFKYTFPKPPLLPSSRDFKDRIVFFKDGEVIYEESYITSPEKAVKFNLAFKHGYGHRVFTPEDAKILGRRFRYPPGNAEKFEWYYVLEP